MLKAGEPNLPRRHSPLDHRIVYSAKDYTDSRYSSVVGPQQLFESSRLEERLDLVRNMHLPLAIGWYVQA